MELRRLYGRSPRMRDFPARDAPVLGHQSAGLRVHSARVRLDMHLEGEPARAARVCARVRLIVRVRELVRVQESDLRKGGHAVRALVGLQVVRLQPVQQQFVASGEQIAAVGASQHGVQELDVVHLVGTPALEHGQRRLLLLLLFHPAG